MLSKPGILLRTEGALVFALSLIFYQSLGARWWVFIAAFLWPDLFMLGYLVSVRLGSQLYNLVHAYALPFAVVAVSYYKQSNALMSFALIWLAHIGLDRALGFGLKYPTFFKDTHLQRVNQIAATVTRPSLDRAT
jgi:hypothetical protein